ncbi:MAG: hypothetical protein ACD_22C00178G0001 [uncultured bacterium]|nr:MAG: hypothetical protein ACD_22C00178G0001 [uncultured bacterium]
MAKKFVPKKGTLNTQINSEIIRISVEFSRVFAQLSLPVTNRKILNRTYTTKSVAPTIRMLWAIPKTTPNARISTDLFFGYFIKYVISRIPRRKIVAKGISFGFAGM